jgi:hypothetical protein
MCLDCGATVWFRPEVVEVSATGHPDDVASVLSAISNAVGAVIPQKPAKGEADKPEKWTKARKSWAFAIGLATIVGGIAAVIALLQH